VNAEGLEKTVIAKNEIETASSRIKEREDSMGVFEVLIIVKNMMLNNGFDP
jgi:hypothetical protein